VGIVDGARSGVKMGSEERKMLKEEGL